MTLTDYFEELHREDILEKRTENKRYKPEIIKKISNSIYAPSIEANLIPAFNKLRPFSTRPLLLSFYSVSSVKYFDSSLDGFILKEPLILDYVSYLGKHLSESGENLFHNFMVVINNLIKEDFMSEYRLTGLEKIKNKIEINELERKDIQWFNKYFNKYRIFFDLTDFRIKKGMAKKDVREKYFLDLKDLQRERELKKRQKNK